MIPFKCPGCAKRFSVKDEFAGMRTKCVKCGDSLLVPGTRSRARVQLQVPPPLEIVESKPIVDSKDCPYCGEQVLAVAKKCKHCGETLDVDMRAAEEDKRLAINSARTQRKKRPPAWYTVRPLVIIGISLLLFGVLGALYYFTMDTSVAVPSSEFMGQSFGGSRVYNIGLMQERQNGLIISLAVCGLGLAIAVIGRRK